MFESSVTPWTVARQAPLSMGFPRQEYWSGLSFASQGDLPDPGIEPTSPVSAGRFCSFFTPEPPGSGTYYQKKFPRQKHSQRGSWAFLVAQW